MPKETIVLSRMMDRSRATTLHHLDALEGQDLHRRFLCEGKELNTAFWIVAHLALSENGLLLAATGGPFVKFSWAKHFTLGAAGLPKEQCPPVDEVLEVMHTVHQRAMAHLAALDDAALDGPNPTSLQAVGPLLRDVVTHAIRHEAGHAGQLAWLCKLYGIKLA